MMKKILFITLFVSLLTACKTTRPEGPIRIACIGTSITYGAGIDGREYNSYPAQLGRMLGKDYEVRNFGVNSATVLDIDGNWYQQKDQYQEAFDYNPDIVIIEFGTNDTKYPDKLDKFEGHYLRMINRFREQGHKPRIILTVPIPAYNDTTDVGGINNRVLNETIIPKIQHMAYCKYLELVNMNFLFPEWIEHIMPDKIHPSSIGAGIMAGRLREQITTPTEWFDMFKNMGSIKPELSNFHGFICNSFEYDGVQCKIVQPKSAAKGHPYVWRARFWGHEPQTDISLLERGFHIVYCDVADLYGSAIAVGRWNKFYDMLKQAGLSDKAVLEGMSRGGLIVYNWAAENPDKVACVYADAPVLDLKSWPMGKSENDTKNVMNVYGFANEADYRDFCGNPIDKAAEIAKAGFPMLHVVGDADDVVPVSENTALFADSIIAAGGCIEVIHKPGIGHHPHSLENPANITNFILRATGLKQNECVIPAPGNEFRSAAGWTECSNWNSVADEITEVIAKMDTMKLLLIGNSITQGFAGNRARVTHSPGRYALTAAIGTDKWVSAGISGDKTQNVLWRIQNGRYGAGKPQNVILSIGINNVTPGIYTPEEIAKGIIACSEAAVKEFPNARIISFGLYPAGAELSNPWRKSCNAIYDYLVAHPVAGVEFINTTEWFVNADGSLKTELYSSDNLHFSEAGYKMLSSKIAEIITVL